MRRVSLETVLGGSGCFPKIHPREGFFALRLRGPYRAIPVAIVYGKTLSCSFLWGIAHLSRDMLQNGVSQRCACVKLSAKRRFRAIGAVLTCLKGCRAMWGITAIVSHCHTIWGH